ncbi:hypothetical protein B0A49_05456, partial [Cryomyces minteri]
MAADTPLSVGAPNHNLQLPIPPPLLHTRSGNVLCDQPSTPTGINHGFTSPAQTPQGSPSKNRLPPGAHDLPDVFANAMKLMPTAGSPAKAPRHQQQSPTSPYKNGFPIAEDKYNDSFTGQDTTALTPGSPTRKSNKENTPPGAARPPLSKESSFTNQAAASRQEPYKPREQAEPAGRQSYTVQRGLTAEELEKLSKPSVKRLANVTQLYFLDYYYDLLSYVHTRQNRLSQFKAQVPPPPATSEPEYQQALSKYLGRERANLRKRRTRLRHGDFQILTQVGQGGYGQVYLAKKVDTKEVCALKVMSKKLLFKLDEIRHVLTERDILTNAKSDWLVSLLYAFQDEKSIYLAMEYVPGGDFRTLLNNTGVLHNRHARFYIAE